MLRSLPATSPPPAHLPCCCTAPQDNVAYKEAQVAQRLVKAERENSTVYLQAGAIGGWWVKCGGGVVRVCQPSWSGVGWGRRADQEHGLPGGLPGRAPAAAHARWRAATQPCLKSTLPLPPLLPNPPQPACPQRIPNDVDLPPIVPFSLVKPTPPAALKPTPDEQQSLFTSVVPDTRCGCAALRWAEVAAQRWVLGAGRVPYGSRGTCPSCALPSRPGCPASRPCCPASRSSLLPSPPVVAPCCSAKALSKYSDMVDNLVR